MRSKFVFILALLTGVLIYIQPVAAAATITIDTFDDDTLPNLIDGQCQLREALQAIGDVSSGSDTDLDGVVNTVDGCDATNGDGVYTIQFAGGGTLIIDNDLDTLPEIPMNYNVTIDGQDNVTIQPSADSYAFNIDSDRTMQFINITFADGGQAIFNSGGNIIINNVTFSNLETDFEGGAMRTYGGSLNITDTLFTDNTSHSTTIGGGALYTSGDTILNNVTFQSNEADQDGGAIYSASWSVEINGGTFNANVANGTDDFQGGGAIFNQDAMLTIDGVTFSANQAPDGSGGALYLNNATTITGSMFSGNSAGGNNAADNFTTEGGGAIYVIDETTVSGSALIGNTAVNGGGVMFRTGTYTITWDNTTIANNVATSNGGGVYFGPTFNNFDITLSNLTIAGNTAVTGGGVAVASDTGFAKLYQTLVANNIGTDCNGPIDSIGYNLIQNTSGCTGLLVTDRVDMGADLGAFAADHYQLMPGSPAVDGGNPTADSCPWAADQKGAPRPTDGDLDGNAVCDIGAIEMPPGTGGNNAPVAGDDSYDTDQDVTLNIPLPGVLSDDTDPDGDPITAELDANASNGSVTLSPDGSFTYTPDTGFAGTDSFTYHATDGMKDSNIATVNIAVNGPNHTPTATADTYNTNEDTLLTVLLPGVLLNDNDDESDPLTALLDSDVSNGTLNLSVDGSFTYMPDLDHTGQDSFTYYADDGNTSSNIVTVTIDVDPVNDAPVAFDDNYVTDEDMPMNISAPGVLSNDIDIDLDVITAVLVDDVTNGTLTLNADGSFDYTPDSGYSGSDSFTYKADDGADESNTATVMITINPATNTSPVAFDDNYATDEDTQLTIAVPGVLGNDVDADLDTLTAALFTDVSNGTLTLNTDGSFSYMPDAGYSGTDSFVYQADDGTDASNNATVTITINPANTVPVANADAYMMNLNTTLNISAPGVLGNDTDADLDTLTAVLDTNVSNGVLTLNTDGSFSYTPSADYFGTDSFMYVANDGTDASNLVTVTITINAVAVNIPPVANVDSYNVDQDTTLNTGAPGVLGNDNDADADTLTAVLDVDVSDGTLTLNGDGSFTYTPDAGYFGADSFTYHANDGTDDSNITTVNITVNEVVVNTPPVANPDSFNTNQDTTLNITAPGVLGNDTDADVDPLTAVLVDDVINGTLTLNSNGSFDYTPDAGYFGSDSFTYKANDGTDDSSTVTVSLTVNQVVANTAPTANVDLYNTDQDTTLNIPAPGVLGNDADADSDPLTAVLVNDVANGTLTLNADGSFGYIPNAGFFGSDGFTYKANDGTADSNVAAVVITVNMVAGNTAPSAGNDAYNVNQDTTLNIAVPGVLGNDTDADSDPLTAALVSDVSNGTLALSATGSFVYTPTSGYSGSDSFTYQANDGTANSNTATVNITINAVASNTAPVAHGDTYNINQDTILNIAAPGLLGNDTDADSDPLTAMLVSNVANGTLALNANGSFVYTPTSGYSGGDSFTYQANDGAANSNTATVSINISPSGSNNAPVANSDAYSTDQDVTLNIAAPGVLGNDTDVDSNPLTAILSTNSSNGTLTLNSDGSFIYTPNAGFSGSDSFSYQANDGAANSAAATVTITVNSGSATPTPDPTDPPGGEGEESAYPPPPDVPNGAALNSEENGVARVGLPDAIANAVNIRVMFQNGSATSWFGAPLYDGGNIGIEAVLQLGVLQAIDIFSPSGLTYFDGGGVFCLRGTGTLIWLAARNAPRVPEIIGSYTVPEFSGFTCATLFEPGMLVLVSQNPAQ